MNKLQILVTTIAVVFGVSFLDGMFEWNLAEGFYIVLGLTYMVCIIWLLKIVYKKN